MSQSEKIADSLAEQLTSQSDERGKYVVKEALHSLVRLAKAEKLAEIKQDLEKVNQVMADANNDGKA